MLIFAAEDVGNADPQAVLVAHAAFKAAESIGWPECRINLAQAAIYLALAPKSNSAYLAIDAALADVREGPRGPSRVTCAIATAPVRTPTARIATRTTSRTPEWTRTTSRTACAAAPSSRRLPRLGGGSGAHPSGWGR